MKAVTVGRSGLRVSPIGLGTQTWGTTTAAAEAERIVRAYLDHGGSLIEASEQARPMIARMLQAGLLADATLVAMLGVDGLAPIGQRVDCSRTNLTRQLDTALAQLGRDHLDLVCVGHWDPLTPPSEVAETLTHFVQQGKARYAGVCGYNGWQLAVTQLATDTPSMIAAITPYNLLARSAETELLPAAEHLGVGVIAGAPLAQGVLTGQYRRGIPPQSRAAQPHRYAEVHGLIPGSEAVVEALRTAADGLKIAPAVAATAWVRHQPGVAAVMVTPRTAEHCTELLDAERVTIPRAIAKALDDVSL